MGDLHMQITAMAVAEAIAIEREACAKIALAIDSGRGNERVIAEAIRARSGVLICLNCADPVDDDKYEYCGTCREMGCPLLPGSAREGS